MVDAFLGDAVGGKIEHLKTFLLLCYASTDVAHTSILGPQEREGGRVGGRRGMWPREREGG